MGISDQTFVYAAPFPNPTSVPFVPTPASPSLPWTPAPEAPTPLPEPPPIASIPSIFWTEDPKEKTMREILDELRLIREILEHPPKSLTEKRMRQMVKGALRRGKKP